MQKKNILIAGASGFVGRWLTEAVSSNNNVTAISRQKYEKSSNKNVTWKCVDLFSRQQTISALKNIDIAIYLVHSMLPKSRLFQGTFYDLDVLIADNFSYACKINNVKQIIYLGGVIPSDKELSQHLKVDLKLKKYSHKIIIT